MKLSIKDSKRSFFADIFKDLLKHIVLTRPQVLADVRNLSATFSDLPGYSFSGLGHEASALLLLSCVDGLPDIPGEVLENLALRAAGQSKDIGNATPTAFLNELTAVCQTYLAEKGTRYQCMFFLQAKNLPEWVLAKPILGKTLRRASKTALSVHRPLIAGICADSELNEIDLVQMKAIEISVVARTQIEAIGAADEVCRVLRAAYFVTQGAGWSFGRQGSRNEFKPSPLYLLREGRKHVQWAYIPHPEIRSITLEETCPRCAEFLLRRLTTIPPVDSPLNALSRALSLFAASGDAVLAHDRLLGMWQALEVLALDDTGATANVAKKIGNLFNNGNETLRLQLLAIAPFRNKLVHAGEFEGERQSSTFLLERIAKKTFIQFTHLSLMLRTRDEFDEFRSMMTKPFKALPTKGRVARSVRKVRGIET